jgi:hypothetical protein
MMFKENLNWALGCLNETKPPQTTKVAGGIDVCFLSKLKQVQKQTGLETVESPLSADQRPAKHLNISLVQSPTPATKWGGTA